MSKWYQMVPLKGLRLHVVLWSVLLLSADSWGSHDSLTPEQLVQHASVIAVGEVTATWHSWDPRTQVVYLNCQLRTEETVKGPAQGVIRIVQPAMTLPDPTPDELTQLPIPSIVRPGTRVVAFVVVYRQNSYLLPTDMRSIYPVSGDHLLEHGLPLSDFVRQIHEVMTGQRQRISGLRDGVSYLSESSGEGWQSLWGGQFTTTGLHWVRPSSGLKTVTVQYDSLYARRNTSFVLSAIDTAIANWETNIWPAGSPSGRGHFLDFQRHQTVTATGELANCEEQDVISRIVWGDLGDAITTASSPRCATGGLAKGFTIVLNKARSPADYWETMSPNKLKGILTHELGHGFGLEDTGTAAQNVMSDPLDTTITTPQWGDRSGAIYCDPGDLAGEIPFSIALAARIYYAEQTAKLTGDLTIPNGKEFRARAGTSIDLNGHAIYVPSGSNGTFKDSTTEWSPKDVTIKSGTTLKGRASTIQQALDRASTHGYSTVNAGSGTYTEQVSMKSGVDLIGTAGSANTTIQYTNGTPVSFTSVSSRLSGFTLKGYTGVALYSGSSASIDSNIIKDSYAGIYMSASSPTIRYNSITANGSSEGGGGVYAGSNSHPVMYSGHNQIKSNGGYGIGCYEGSEPQLGTETQGYHGLNNFRYNGGMNLTASINCGLISAVNNWWGTANEDSIRQKLSHAQGPDYIDYAPWLADSSAKIIPLAEDWRKMAAKAAYRRAWESLLEGKPSQALSQGKQVVAEYSDLQEALFALDLVMTAYGRLEDRTGQLAYLEDTAKGYASSELGALASEFIIQVLMSQGQYMKAMERTEEVLERYPDRERNEWVLFQKGLLYELLGDRAKEEKAFWSFLARHPVDPKNGPNDLLPSLARIQLGLDPLMGNVAVKSAPTAPAEDGGQVVFEPVTPNPSNPQTTLTFVLPHTEEVTLVICNTLGQVARTLVDHTRFTAGRQRLIWDGRNSSGEEVPSGVYFARLNAGAATSVRKLLFLR